ncbi:MAG: ribosomal-processing cysteine protease Prp [Hespellia sp.]|nr:ribosomal-processing cysteine protease Prp [Hespellia sp.]
MINVTIYKNEKHICMGFNAIGHAGSADEGQDIVCAAASVLMVNTINAIEAFASDDSSLVSDDKEGLVDFTLSKPPTHDAELLLKTMILGLEEIANDYKDYINIDFREV